MFFGIVIIILLYITDLAKFKGAWWPGKSPQCLKLSNSGNSLNLWLPQNGTKAICKWINNLIAVIILKMMEIEIGNHGSKSIIVVSLTHTFVIIVNEQRVDGSWLEKSWFKNNESRPLSRGSGAGSPEPRLRSIISQFFFNLRCTLMGFESNYQVSSLSNQRYTYKFFTTLIVNGGSHKNNTSLAHTQKINPWFITGFTDGEGNFLISVTKNNKSSIGFKVALFFSIGIHVKDKSLLQKIRNLLSVGTIYKLGEQSIQLKVFSVKDLNIIINHFDKFPLKTKKRSEYELWKQVFNIIKNKEHLTKEGLLKILAIKASMSRGLNPELKAAYTDIVPVIRPAVTNKKIEHFDGEWIAGFTSAEGSFLINLNRSPLYRTGYQVQLVFQLTQHSRDENLMKILIKYFDCGSIIKDRESIKYRVEKFSDNYEKIIPFFSLNRIWGVKFLDYLDWCKVADIIKEKGHLTIEGLNKIRELKQGMNRGRR